MAAEEHVGRIAGLAISFGIGIAVAVGGIGEAAAEPADSSSATGSAATDSAATDSAATDSGQTSEPSSDPANGPTTGAGSTTDDTASEPPAGDPDESSPRESSSQSRSASEARAQTEAESTTEPDTDLNREAPDIATTVRRTSVESSDRETADTQEFSTTRLTVDSDQPDTVSPAAPDVPTPRRQAPVETQALAAVVGAARPTNTAPTATVTTSAPDGITGVTRVAVTAVDIDSDALTYTASRPTWGWVSNLGDGNFTYSTNEFIRLLARFIPFIRSDRFSVTVNDGQGGTTSVKVNTAVVPLNAAPVVRSRSVGAPDTATGTVVGGVSATDPNFDSLSYIGSTTVTDKGTVAVNGGGGFT